MFDSNNLCIEHVDEILGVDSKPTYSIQCQVYKSVLDFVVQNIDSVKAIYKLEQLQSEKSERLAARDWSKDWALGLDTDSVTLIFIIIATQWGQECK